MSTVKLTADVRDFVGRPVEGASLWITAPAIKHDGVLRASKLTKVDFDSRGRLSVDLLATNTPGTDPDDWQYCFSVHWKGGALRKFYAVLTEDANLADLIPLDPTEPEYLPVYVPLPGPEGPEGPKGDKGDTGFSQHELGYAETLATYTSTPTAGYDFTKPIPGLMLSITGEGKPVEIEAYLPGVYASSAWHDLLPYITVNGGIEGAGIVVISRSALTTDGPPVILKRRLVLEEGQTYVFRAGVGLVSPGPSVTVYATSYQPAYLAVNSR